MAIIPPGPLAIAAALLGPLPLRVAYPGSGTVEDADGWTVAKCARPEIAEALVAVVNALQQERARDDRYEPVNGMDPRD